MNKEKAQSTTLIIFGLLGVLVFIAAHNILHTEIAKLATNTMVITYTFLCILYATWVVQGCNEYAHTHMVISQCLYVFLGVLYIALAVSCVLSGFDSMSIS